MTHNSFNFQMDIINPIRTFCKINGIRLDKLGPVITLSSCVYNQKLAGDTPLELDPPSSYSYSVDTDTTQVKQYGQCVLATHKLNETCS